MAVVLCQKHLWDSPGFTHPKATSPCGISGAIGDITMGQILKWGFSWRSATWRTRWGGETKRFCVKAWCLELINVYKSGKFLMIFYDTLSYTVYIYIYTPCIHIFFLWMLNRWSLRHPLFLFGGRFFMSWWSAHWGDLQLWRRCGAKWKSRNDMEGLYLGKYPAW